MPYTLSITLATGSGVEQTALRAQLVDTDGNNVGSEIIHKFTPIGEDFYLWTYDGFPDGFRGAANIYDANNPSTILINVSINPEEAENLDMKVSEVTLPEYNITIGHVTGTLVNNAVISDTSPTSQISIVTGVKR